MNPAGNEAIGNLVCSNGCLDTFSALLKYCLSQILFEALGVMQGGPSSVVSFQHTA